MKKTLSGMLLFILLMTVFVSCAWKGPNEPTQNPVSSTTQWGAATDATTKRPICEPEDIILQPEHDVFADLPYKVEYRCRFYSLQGWVIDLGNAIDPGAGKFASGDFGRIDMNNPNGPSEMRVVTFIKKFKIPKDAFVTDLEKQIEIEREIALSMGEDLDVEFREPYNPDIIYTFDNEVINAYYRRENPVVPDWTKVKTYETYAAYLKENPE